MSIPPYAPAIRDAIAHGDLREMKSLLIQAKQLRQSAGRSARRHRPAGEGVGKLSEDAGAPQVLIRRDQEVAR